jgi:ElaB/YqjD/DUF883 family membrane-anchored ribosome-binding protein
MTGKNFRPSGKTDRPKERRQHMHHDIRASGERIASDFQALLNDTEGLLRAVSGASGETIENTRERIQQRVDALRKTLADGQDSAVKNARKAALSADRYVHDNPWPIIGGALAAGVILGLLARRGLDASLARDLH